MLQLSEVHLDTVNDEPLNISLYYEFSNLFVALEIWIVVHNDLFGLFESQSEFQYEFELILSLEILVRSLKCATQSNSRYKNDQKNKFRFHIRTPPFCLW